VDGYSFADLKISIGKPYPAAILLISTNTSYCGEIQFILKAQQQQQQRRTLLPLCCQYRAYGLDGCPNPSHQTAALHAAAAAAAAAAALAVNISSNK
jgi:hypothetical protein